MTKATIHNRLRDHELAVISTLLGIITLCWLAYQPAIPGFFMLDDFDNLSPLEIGVVDISSARDYLATGKAGPLGRPISKLSFLLDDNTWPSTPEAFKRTNLLLHILIGIIIFAAARLILRPHESPMASNWLAVFITAIWLLHPIQVSTVMYVVQRMTQLASLFVIAGVAVHMAIRTRPTVMRPKHLIGLSISLATFTALGVFSKESGILLPMYILVLESTVLAQAAASRAFVLWKRVFIILPCAALAGYLAYLPRWLNSYGTRDFSLSERLITEPVVLLDYLASLLSMRVSGMGLFQDDYVIYTSLLQPAPLISMLLLAGLAVISVYYRKQFPLFSFGVLWFLAGHLLESTTISLELYFEHRNYLPIFGPILALTVGIHRGLHKISQDIHKVAPMVAVAITAIAGATTWGYANEWGSPLRIIPIWAAEHPDSPRAQRTYAHTLAAAGEINGALDTLDYAYSQFPHDLSIPLISIDIACKTGKPLRYELPRLIENMPHHRWTDGLRPALQSLFDGYLDSECSEQSSYLHELVPALFNLQDADLWHNAIAGIFVLSGNMYIQEGNANAALTAYQIIDNIKPSTASALRLAGLYLLAHEYEKARTALQIAQSREDDGSRWYKPSKAQEYAEKFKLIDQRQRAFEEKLTDR